MQTTVLPVKDLSSPAAIAGNLRAELSATCDLAGLVITFSNTSNISLCLISEFMNHNPYSNNATATVHPEDRPDVEAESYQLNPALQQALSCLDIKLEDELTRFRHKLEHRESDPQSPPQLVDSEVDSDAEPLEPAIASTTITAEDYEIIPPSGGFIIINGTPLPATSFTAITTFDRAPLVVHGEDISVAHQNLDLNFTSGGQIAPFREDYIASSQELLRQIQAGATNPPESAHRPQTVTSPTKSRWITPLKLGSVAAACVIVGAGTYTYFNPTILAPLTATKVGTVTATTTSSLGQIVQSPNLAATEFTELNLSNLNTIKIATTAPASNVSTIANPVGTTTTAPAAIPFTPVNTQTIAPPTSQAQPRLADSLVKSLLPSNFQAFARSSQTPLPQPGVRR
jgi:hypothetical protein